MKQYDHESNATYLTRFKSMVQTLKIAGGEHVLVSKVMLGKELSSATDDEINAEREKFLAMCFILRSNEVTYKKLLDDLKRSTNLGRDEYPEILTGAFDGVHLYGSSGRKAYTQSVLNIFKEAGIVEKDFDHKDCFQTKYQSNNKKL